MKVRWLEPAARIVAAGLVLVAIVWFVPARGLPLDDAWIHQVVARTFATEGTLGYAPGQHGAAATSYLWAALLAVNFAVLHIAPETWALVLNTVAALASVDLLYRILARAVPIDVASWRPFALVVAFGASVSANVLWFVGSGMESMPLVAFALGSIALATTDDLGPGRALASGALAGLLALLRPDAIVFGPILLAYLALRHFRARRQAVVLVGAAMLPWLLAVALYTGSNLLKTGLVLPSTLAGRRWLWFSSKDGLDGSAHRTWYLDTWAQRLGSYTFDTSLAVTWVLAGVALYGAYRLVRTRGRGADGARLLLFWTLFHASFYALMLPTPGHGGRYQPLVPLLFAALVPIGATLGIVRLVELARPAALRIAFPVVALVTVLPLAILGASTAGTLRTANILAVDHIRNTEIAAGQYIATLPPGNVASFDIGGVGMVAGRPILDLGGLSEASTASLLMSGRIAEWIAQKDVRWIVLPDGGEPVLPLVDTFTRRLHIGDRPDLHLVPVRIFETPFAEWAPGIQATWNAAPRQVVYRVERIAPVAPRPNTPVPASARRQIHDAAGLATPNDRRVAEHMLGVLADRGIDASIDVTPTNAPGTGGPCRLRVGPWGVGVDGCDALDPAFVRSTAWEWSERYLDLGDVGGAVRALPHVLVAAKRRSDPFFEAPLAPLNPPVPGGSVPPTTGVADGGLWILAGALAALVLVDVVFRRRLLAGLVASGLVLVACGRSDLGSAIGRGRGAVLAALDRGAEVEPKGAGWSPLFAAADHGDVEIASLLLERGASPARHLEDGTFPLHLAARRGHAGVVAALLARSPEGLNEAAGPRKRTPLHDAVAAGSLPAVRLLLASGARIDAMDAFGQTPLHLAAALDPAVAVPIASHLVSRSAPLQRQDERGFTPLHAAAFANAPALVRALVDERALVQTTPAGETALDLALRYGKPEAAAVLVAAGAQLHGDALPPLHEAARLDRVGTVASLLGLGIDPTLAHDGKTAEATAKEAGSKAAAALLHERAR